MDNENIKNLVGQDPEQAIEWLKQAAEQGSAIAQYRLGLLYYQGEIDEEYFGEWQDWMEKAADQGHEEAYELLREYYADMQSGLEHDGYV